MKMIDYLENESTDVQIEVIGKAGAGYNTPTIVNVNGIKGFKKKSINCQTFDSFEYLISVLGKLLNIKVADTYIFEDGSIFSKSVINDNEQLLTISDVIEKLLKNGLITKEEIEEKRTFDGNLEVINYNNQDHYLVKTDEEIEYAVNYVIKVINKLNITNKDEIIKDYIRMCFLDCLTGNKDRVNGNYGLIKNGNQLTFAPLFDSSTISMNNENVSENLVQLNHYYIDREALLNYITKNYPDYVDDILNADIESVRKTLDEISSKVLNENDKKWFDNMVTNNILTSLSQRTR